MFLDEHGLRRDDFEPELRAMLDEFRPVVAAMNETGARQALPEHFLMAILRAAGSWLVKRFDTKNVRGGMVATSVGKAIAAKEVVVGKELTRDRIAPGTEAMLQRMAERLGQGDVPVGRHELVLTWAALGSCSPRTARLFESGGLPAKGLLADLDVEMTKPLPPEIRVFADDGTVNLEAFDPTGLRILRRLESEGRSLGLEFIGPPLLFYALVGQEDGLTDRALRAQQVAPRVISEGLVVRLRGVGKGRLSELRLRLDAMQPTIQRVFRAAALDAGDYGCPRIGEAHLLRALVAEDETIVGATLRDHKADPEELRKYALANHDPSAAETKTLELPPVDEILATLRGRIVGQDHVIASLEPLLKRLRFGYTQPNKPMGVFLFLGPSGTGKTEIAKVLAKCLYGSEEQIVFLEMGQFGAEHDKSMFIGAPPGYVGYGEGQLTNGLRDRPEAVVLFDEVEKAHRSVFDVLLRFLDEGIIRDPAGPARDGRKCLIVLTSNILLDEVCDFSEDDSSAGEPAEGKIPSLRQLYTMDPHTRQSKIRGALRRIAFFRPEFINRVDEIILFRPLGMADYRIIVRNRLAAEGQRFRQEKQREILYGDDLTETLAARCSTRAQEGARVVGKVIAQDVVAPIIDFFVVPGHESCLRVQVRVVGEQIAIESA